MTPPDAAGQTAAQLNRPAAELPAACDVLVVGAGPAGSAAARTLALAGFDVVLVDQHAFPRDKVCGDGLIPDAHRALHRLGVLDAVMAAAQSARHVRCIGPRGAFVDVPGTLAVLPRRELDLLLARAAVDAGARMFAPLRFVAPLEDERGRVIGATLRPPRADNDNVAHPIRAHWVVLATGAVPQALIAAGLCARRTPSAVALRGYVEHAGMVGRITDLQVLWHRRLKPGYGWIFPCPNGMFNVGVGIAHGHGRDQAKAADVNLREVFAAFIDLHAPARDLLAGGQLVGELKGAPLRCSLEGARFSRDGLLVTGEAAGSTYALSGEGIGKALETGLLAAQTLIEARAQALGDAALRSRYAAALHALRPRFAVYERANRINRHPWLVDLLVWSAKRSPERLQRMSGVLEETHTPGNLISARGLMRLMLQR